MTVRASIVLLVLTLAAGSCSQEPQPPGSARASASGETPLSLAFGTYTADKPTDVVDQFRPLLDRLEQRLASKLERPVEIKMQIAPSYEQGIAALVEGRVDFARFGPASYVMATEANPGIVLMAMESRNGKKSFHGIICVHRDSDIDSMEMLTGRRFAFGNERSTIGRYLAQQLLADHGVHAGRLAAWEYLGRHDRVGAAVAAGQFDAGALKDSTFEKLVAAGEPLRELVVIGVVTKPWLAREGLPVDVREAIAAALLQMTDEDVLGAMEFDGLMAGEDADYDPIRRAIAGSVRFFEQAEAVR
jgi:phosphonate transport system substrate-binding protein